MTYGALHFMSNLNLTIQEIQTDLTNTERDIQALSNIVESLDIFIFQSGGEDRSAFKTDRLKYSALLAEACVLKSKSQSALIEAIDHEAWKDEQLTHRLDRDQDPSL